MYQKEVVTSAQAQPLTKWLTSTRGRRTCSLSHRGWTLGFDQSGVLHSGRTKRNTLSEIFAFALMRCARRLFDVNSRQTTPQPNRTTTRSQRRQMSCMFAVPPRNECANYHVRQCVNHPDSIRLSCACSSVFVQPGFDLANSF